VPPYRITPAHDPSIQLPFVLPIKGRTKPLSFSLPKLHYLDRELLTEYDKWCDSDESKQYALGSTGRDAYGTQKLLELALPEHSEFWAKLTIGELLDISRHWNAESKLTIPESEASADS
jgi:hypothetical protein